MIVEYLNVNANKLHDELIKNGIIPLLVEHDANYDKEGNLISPAVHTWITFADDTDMTLVQQIIDAHDPTPLPQPKTEFELLQEKFEQQQQIIDAMLGVSE